MTATGSSFGTHECLAVIEHLKTLRCLGLKPESAMIAVVPMLREIMPPCWSRVCLCEPDATMGITAGENPQGITPSPAFPPQACSQSPSCSFLPEGSPMSLHDQHRTLGESHDAVHAARGHRRMTPNGLQRAERKEQLV